VDCELSVECLDPLGQALEAGAGVRTAPPCPSRTSTRSRGLCASISTREGGIEAASTRSGIAGVTSARRLRRGPATTGRTINAAAAIMILVFGAFILSGQRIVELAGVGRRAGWRSTR
jgi:hypothetical protein